MLDGFPPLTLAAAIDPQPGPVERRANDPRVLVVFAPDRKDATLRVQRAMLRGSNDELVERDVHLIEVVSDTVAGAKEYAGALRQRYGVSSSRFSVVLIGRDGGIKLRAEHAVSLDALVGTIDAMPMRREEMRQAARH